MLFIYRKGKNKCALRQLFFATQQVVACFSFLAFLIVLTEKNTLEITKQCLDKRCFTILYKVKISVN